MYRPTLKDRHNPFFGDYFFSLFILLFLWTGAIIHILLLFLSPVLEEKFGLDHDWFWALLMLAVYAFGFAIHYTDGFLETTKKYKVSKSGYVYGYKDIPNRYVEVDVHKDSYLARFQEYITDQLTGYRDRLLETANVSGAVYLTYPLEKETAKLKKSWTEVDSSKGEPLVFAEPYAFHKSKVTFAFLNSDGTYELKSVDPDTNVLTSLGTALELADCHLVLTV